MVIPIHTIRDHQLIHHFRPKRSAIGAATKAPIRVPIDSCRRVLAYVDTRTGDDKEGTAYQGNNQTRADITEMVSPI